MKLKQAVAVLAVLVGISTSGQAQATFMTNGLVAYYPFNGNANDASGNGNDGVAYGASLTVDRLGRPANTYCFDGTDNYVSAVISNLPSGGAPRTMTAWIMPTKAHPDAMLGFIGYGAGGQASQFGLTVDPDQGISFWGGYADFSPHLPAPLGTWSFVAISYSDNTVRLSVNGVTATGTGITLNTVNNGRFFFGVTSMDGSGPSWPLGQWERWFTGSIDDVRIYSRALSDQEVQALYEYEAPARPPFSDGLVAYYPFSRNSNDESGNGNNGTVSGAELAGDRFGVGSSAYAFDGTNSIITIPSSWQFDSPAHTLCFWISASSWDSPTPYMELLAKDAEQVDQREWVMQAIRGGSIRSSIFTSTGEQLVDTSTPLNVDQWYHVVAVWDGAVSTTYVNGQVAATIPTTGTLRIIDTPVRVGGHEVTHQNFHGRMDDVRIYNRALSDVEIQALYKYESQPPAPRRARATVQVVNGFIVGFTITDPGYGYTNNPPPAVRIRDASGVDATAHAVVEDQQVVRLEIDNTGRGYSTNATVVIAPPPFSPTLKIEVLKVALEMSVVLGRKYQLEASTDLQTWAKVGVAFVSEDDTIRQEFDVTATGRFFRLNEVP